MILIALIKTYPLATLITCHPSGPWISHLPLVLEIENDRMVLYGHLAKANPHSDLLSKHDVPTWNYMTVHIKGSCQMIEDGDGIEMCLRKLTHHMESARETPWEFWIPEDLKDQALEKHIVGFKIEVDDMQAKFKLSQNRSAADYAGVLRGLEQQKDDNSQAILKKMRSLK